MTKGENRHVVGDRLVGLKQDAFQDFYCACLKVGQDHTDRETKK